MPGPAFLHGEDVTLHVVEDDDVAFLYETINDPDVRAGLTFARPKTEREEREWVESVTDPDADDVHFLICADGAPVGTVGLRGVDSRAGTGELGYYLAADAWGHGYATDAARTLVEYAFTELRLHRVHARAFADNEGSRRVLEKVGFEHEGVLRDHWYRRGGHADVHLYGLLEGEWDG
ncbi:GNAT family N-acetyltransferase [Halomicroarcula sp. F13]|uniref:GNAT family N-acetyltransferase n=1 Tax=Haloarcula rubra TaxID=2487747 RepID=A0AAW4PKL1_9EURY|nr:GNAT family protein [Halomicroarcula rubra]MBX0321626.1 GNAT family N-acetyltransferase [Halomicroarcula rubra]